MEQLVITKKTREVGTSAGVLLPRSWLNKQVVVTLYEPSNEKILADIIGCLSEHKLNEEVKGIYLYGSYARGDYDFDSDLDIFVITTNINKLISKNNYEIILVSESSFSKNLESNLNYLSIVSEAKVLLNKELIEKYRNQKTKAKLTKYYSEIKRITNINKEAVNNCAMQKIMVPDGIIYSLILRLRELYLIRCLHSESAYKKEDFLRKIGDSLYATYLRVKRNGKELNNTKPEELKKIIELTKTWLKELKN